METSFSSQQAAAQPKLLIYQSTLLKRFQEIIELIPTESTDRQTAAAQSYQIQVHTAGIIRTAEDLLTMTRQLKEAWLLGQIGEEEKVDEKKVDDDAKFVGEWLKEKIREAEVVEK